MAANVKLAIMDQFDRATGPLVARMMEGFRASIPAYSALPEETLRQVREVVQDNLNCFSRCLRRGSDPTREELAPFRDSASRRAREGVSLAGVLEAYRMGARVAWGELRGIVEEYGEHALGLEFATLVMSYIDSVSEAVADAYISEFEELASDREGARRDFIDGLLDGSLADAELTARAEALGLDAASSYVVCLICMVEGSAEGDELRAKQRTLRGMAAALPHGQRSLIVNRGHELVAVVPARPGGEEELSERLGRFVARASETVGERLAAGIGRVHEGVTELASGYREATVALAAAKGGEAGIAVYGQVLMEELLLREPAIARRMVQATLQPLSAHPYLLETLEAYLKHGPSLPEVGERLHVHANTVAYRLGRVRDLTGRDPRTPNGVAHLALALRAAELLGDTLE